MSRSSRTLGIHAVVAASLLLSCGTRAWAQTPHRKLAQFRVSISGLSATIDPVAPVVPKGIASGINVIVRAGGQDLTAAQAMTLLGVDFEVNAELSGPGLNQVITLPVKGAGWTMPEDPLLLPLPPLPIAGDYSIRNLRIVNGGRTVLELEPREATLRVIDQILVTSVKTRPLTLEEIRAKGIVLDSDDYMGFEFNLALKLDSNVVNLKFPAVFDRNGIEVPRTHYQGSAAVEREGVKLPGGVAAPITWVPMLLEAEDDAGAKQIALAGGGDGNGQIRIPSVLVIPGNVGYLKQFFSAQLYVANGAPAGCGLTVRDVTGTIKMPAGDDKAVGTADDPLALPELLREGNVILQPTTMSVLGLGPDGEPGTSDDVATFAPGEQGQAEFLLRGEKEGYHALQFDIAAILDGLPVGPVKVKGTASGGVLVRNARFEMAFTVPTVVRRNERFKLYATVSNVGEGDANDVTVKLDTLRMANLKLIGPESIHIETIPAGEAQTLAFEFESLRTGAVTAAYLRFDPSGETDVSGSLNFTVGLSELGVPLSPDTLSLPSSVGELPPALVDAAMHVLGLAWSNANARKLPAGIVRIDRNEVVEKALALAEVGLRYQLGQPLEAGLRDLAFDFHGGDPVDPGFDQLLRTSRAGHNFGAALGAVLAPAAQEAGFVAYEEALAELAASGPDFVSVLVHGSPDVTVFDDAGRRLTTIAPPATTPPNSNAVPASEISGGVVLPLGSDGDPAFLVLITTPQASTFRVALTAAAEWSFTLPRGDGSFGRVVGSSAGPAEITLDLTHPDSPYVSEGGDTPVVVPLTPASFQSTGPNLISANVIGPETLPAASAHGLSAAFLYDRIVDPTSSAAPASYQIDDNAVVWAKRQLSGRIVLATLAAPEGPYVPVLVSVSGVSDGRGAEGLAATVPLQSRLEDPGGVVTGRVVQSDGTPLRQGTVYYYNWPYDPTCTADVYPPGRLFSAAPINADGWYALHYVRQSECGGPFTVRTQDPVSTSLREVQSYVRMPGERIQLDLALVGQGSVGGVVRDLLGGPVAGANVLATSLVDKGLAGNAVTDSAGRYLVPGLTVGPVAVRAAKGIALGRNSGVIQRAGSTVTIDVVLDGGTVSISGRVLRVEDGQTSALPGVVVVYAIGGLPAGYTWSEADGSYLIDGMPAGAFSVAVQGYGVSRTGHAFANETITGFDLIKEVAAGDGTETAQLGEASGRVFFADRVTPAPNVVVARDVTDLAHLNGVSNYTYTDGEGRYTLANLPTGQVTIGAVTRDKARLGYASGFVDPSTGKATDVNITLSGLGTAVFKVLGPGGEPLANQEVRIIADIVNWGSCTDPCGCTAVTTNASGIVTLPDRPMGSVSVKALRRFNGVMDVVNGSVRLTADGQTAYGELRFAGVGTVTGTLVPPPGVVITGGELSLASPVFINDGEFVCGLEQKTWYHGAIPHSNVYTVSGVNVGNVAVTAQNDFAGRGAVSGTLAKHGGTLTLPPIQWPDKIAGELSGDVLLPDGVTLAGAGVEVRADGPLPDVTVRTDAKGHFAFATILPAGLYTLTVMDGVTGGMARETVLLKVALPTTHNVRLKGRGSVAVSVLDGAEPVETAVVTLQEQDYPNRSFEAVLRPGSGGQATFESVFEGRVGVTVRDSFGRGGSNSGTISAPGQAISITVQVTQTGNVRGRFFMPDQDHSPIPFATAKLIRNGQRVSQQTTSSMDPVGRFSFEYVPLGHVQVELEDPLTRRTGVGEGDLVSDGQEIYLEVTALGLGEVRGQVLQSRAGGEALPVPLAEVQITSGDFSATTFSDGQGAYSMDGVPEGTVVVGAFMPSGRNRLYPGSSTGVLEGEDDLLPLDVRLQDTGIVTGQVRGRNGQGISGIASVKLNVTDGPSQGWLRTSPTYDSADQKALFRFDDVPTGNAKLTADVVGSKDAGSSAPFVVPSGTIDVPIDLRGLGVLRVLAQDNGGSPVNGSLTVDIGSGDFTNHFAQPISGAATFNDVFADGATVNLTAKPGDFNLYGAASGTVEAGSTVEEPTQITVRLGPAGTVSGKVSLGGQGVKGAEVRLLPLQATSDYAGSQPAAAHWTDDSGAFAFLGVPYGRFKVTAHEPISGSDAVPFIAELAVASLGIGDLPLDSNPPQIAFAEPLAGSSRRELGGPVVLNVSDVGSGIDATTLRITYPNGHVQALTPEAGVASGQLVASLLTVGPNRLKARVQDNVGQTTETTVDFTILGGRLAGVVTRETIGVPATVKIGSQYVLQTDAAGHFEQDGLRPGNYTITAVDPESALTKAVAVTLGDGQVRDDLALELPSFRTIIGRVHAPDQPTLGVEHVTVKCVTSTCAGRSAVTSSDGQFDLGAFTPGTYTLEATAPDTDRGRATLTVVAGQPAPTPAIELNGVGNVVVTVTKNSTPIAGASVSFTSSAPFVPNQYSGTTNTDGQLTVERVLWGTFKVHATLGALVGDSEQVVLSTNDVPLAVSVPLLDVTAPKVIAVVPDKNAIEVPTNATIRATFDEPLSLAPTIVVKAGTTTVDGSVSLVESDTVAVFTPSPHLSANEAYTVTVTAAKDLSGNTQNVAWTSGFKTTDDTPPTLNWTSPSYVNPTAGVSGWLATATPLIRIGINDGATGSGLDYTSAAMSLDGAAVTPGVVAGDLSYTATVPLEEGPHALVASIKDRAGNLGTYTTTFGVDTTAPDAAELVKPTAGQVVTTPVAVEASATDATSEVHWIGIYVDGGASPSLELYGPSFSGTLSGLADGRHTLTARAKDKPYNLGPAGTSVTVLVDNKPLNVSITSPAITPVAHVRETLLVKATTNEPVKSVTFSVPNHDPITITPQQPNQLAFEQLFTLTQADASPDGLTPSTIRVDAVGLQDETDSDTRGVVVDWSAPPQPDTNLITAEIADGGLAVVIGQRHAVEGGATVEITNKSRDDPEPMTTTTAAGDGLFYGKIPGVLGDVLELRAIDSVGNASQAVPVTVGHRTSQDGVPLTGMLMWLDAADIGADDVEVVDGVSYVKHWKDRTEREDAGLANDASQSTASARPVLSASAANGMPAVTFDGNSDSVVFTDRLTAIRTVFWVLKEDAAATSAYRPMLGDTANASPWTNWRGELGAPGPLWQAGAAAAIRGGQTWLNGSPVDGTVATRPRTLSVVSLVTTSAVTANTFGKEYYGDYWWGDLAELIIYDRALSPTDFQAVQQYLITKYRPGGITSVGAPIVQPAGGVFSGAVGVTLTTATPVSSTTIRYTLNGDEPTETSDAYTGPLTIGDTTTLRARAFREGYTASEVTVVTFTEAEEATPLLVTRGDGTSDDGSLSLWLRADAGVPTRLGDFWEDQSGKLNHATQMSSSAIARLQVGAANGLPAMRFDGNDLVGFTRLTDIRTVFWVLKEDAAATSAYRPMLGDTANASPWTNWRGELGAPGPLWQAGAAPAIRDGQTWLNGSPVDGTVAKRPRTLSVVSLVTTSAVTANNFGKEYYGAYWWGDLAELIIYNRELTAIEREAVENYLLFKYRIEVTPGEPAAVAPPRISPAGAVFSGSIGVTLVTATPRAEIYYTTDGSEPTESSLRYQEGHPVQLSETTTLRARAFRSDASPSEIRVATFVEALDAAPVVVTQAADGTPDGSLRLWWRADAGLATSHAQTWFDQSGNGNDGTQKSSLAIPQLVPDAANGLPAVHFDGNDTLAFTRLTDIRTVFWVLKEDAAATSAYRPLLGDTANVSPWTNWRGELGTPGPLWQAGAAAAIRDGQTWLNGSPVDGTVAKRPRTLSVVSLVTTSAVTANNFGKEYYGAYWWGDLAELIIYNRELTAIEREAVENYLLFKYRIEVTPGEPAAVAPPRISPAGAVFSGSIGVTLATATPRAEIYYTTDGSEPTESSLRYQEGHPVQLSETTTLRARAFRSDASPSEIRVATFVEALDAAPVMVTQAADGTPDGSLRLWWRADAGLATSHAQTWFDQSGNGNDGTQKSSLAIPQLVPDAANGLPAVHFDGNDTLAFTRLTDIRTVFWVLKEDAAATSAYRPLLGDTANVSPWTNWRGELGTPGPLWQAGAAAAIRGGQTWLNGSPVDGTVAKRPRTLSVVSLVTTSAVTADNFGKEYYGAYWWGDLAELIIYNRELTVIEREAVENYLLLKYRLKEGPSISPPGGSYAAAPPLVTLATSIPGATIHYTLDGSEPRFDSPTYDLPFAVILPQTVKAATFIGTKGVSATTSASFVVEPEGGPKQVTGLQLWWRADRGFSSATGVVWQDESGLTNPNNGTQTSAAAAPKLRVGALNGLPAVHFDGDDWLLFTSSLTTIQTVFWVIREDAAAGTGYRFLLGDAGNYHFCSGATRQIWSSTYTSSFIRGGDTRINGLVVDGTTTNRPTAFSVISLVTTGMVSADAFSRDRGNGRSWFGDLAELIVYGERLSDADRQQVESYLTTKYGIE